jgi:hypothetical protein
MTDLPRNSPFQFGLEGLMAWTALVASVLFAIKTNSAFGMLPLVAAAGWIVWRRLGPKFPPATRS